MDTYVPAQFATARIRGGSLSRRRGHGLRPYGRSSNRPRDTYTELFRIRDALCTLRLPERCRGGGSDKAQGRQSAEHDLLLRLVEGPWARSPEFHGHVCSVAKPGPAGELAVHCAAGNCKQNVSYFHTTWPWLSFGAMSDRVGQQGRDALVDRESKSCIARQRESCCFPLSQGV